MIWRRDRRELFTLSDPVLAGSQNLFRGGTQSVGQFSLIQNITNGLKARS